MLRRYVVPFVSILKLVKNQAPYTKQRLETPLANMWNFWIMLAREWYWLFKFKLLSYINASNWYHLITIYTSCPTLLLFWSSRWVRQLNGHTKWLWKAQKWITKINDFRRLQDWSDLTTTDHQHQIWPWCAWSAKQRLISKPKYWLLWNNHTNLFHDWRRPI